MQLQSKYQSYTFASFPLVTTGLICTKVNKIVIRIKKQICGQTKIAHLCVYEEKNSLSIRKTVVQKQSKIF